jgi:hypothetical protein
MTHRFGDAVRADESSTSSAARFAGTESGLPLAPKAPPDGLRLVGTHIAA